MHDIGKLRGLGDLVARGASLLGAKPQPGCGCKRRQEILNRWIPFRRRVDIPDLWIPRRQSLSPSIYTFGPGFSGGGGSGGYVGIPPTPLLQNATNSNWFVDATGKAVVLAGSQTWTTMQDMGNAFASYAAAQSGMPAFDFAAYINLLKGHNHNVTILWRKDLPQACNWGAGGQWRMADIGMPWARSATSGANDGGNQFDLNTFNQPFFDRLRARVIQLRQNGIYAIVQMFDGLGLSTFRCTGNASPNGDGYPLTGGNNINSIDDGGGTGSMTNSVPNSMTAFQVALMKKFVDTVSDQPNVIWELAEEAPTGSLSWHTYMIGQLQTYEATKPVQHPILFATLDVSAANDSDLYNSNAVSIAPKTKFPTVGGNCGSGAPACKVVINDSDHTYFSMWNDSSQVNRQFIWENFTNGMNLLFMDPGLIFAGPSSTWVNRNLCDGGTAPANGVCTAYDTRWNNFRDNLGQVVLYGNTKLNLSSMTGQPSLASTAFCLANNAGVGAQFIVYAPSGGAFTVNLSAQSGHSLAIEWFDPANISTSSGGTIAGGSSTQSFTPPWGSARDAVLYLSEL